LPTLAVVKVPLGLGGTSGSGNHSAHLWLTQSVLVGVAAPLIWTGPVRAQQWSPC
jgi:hypothetical protein